VLYFSPYVCHYAIREKREMSSRSQLEKKIESQRQEITELESKILEKRAFLQGLQEALRFMPRDELDESKPPQELRPGSGMAKVKALLKKVGHPMYIEDILKGIGKECNKANKVSLGGSLARYARRGETFVRTAPNTFGLIEHTSSRSQPEDEPPEDFGMEEEDQDGDLLPEEDDLPFKQ
jgi:hypothetical protein